MRPLRLELKGFTAFRDEQAVDFEGLDLFAISGPTGSGKSSILDAITYALYGFVERVGKQTAQLVSQGQTRMAVTLDFEVGDKRFRVARSTPATRGATRILLERWDDGGWRQAGEGADRVREANEMIERALGLDYEAFTRSVLLPQGRFAEFLVGDAAERRRILIELLGLELFERLAKRAGEVKRDATITAETNEHLLETEYAGVSPEAVAEADDAARKAEVREDALGKAEAQVRGIAERWAKVESEIRDLVSCANDARRAAGSVGASARSLEGLAGRLAEAEAAVKEQTRISAAAAKRAEKAATARASAEARWGRPKDLGAPTCEGRGSVRRARWGGRSRGRAEEGGRGAAEARQGPGRRRAWARDGGDPSGSRPRCARSGEGEPRGGPSRRHGRGGSDGRACGRYLPRLRRSGRGAS